MELAEHAVLAYITGPPWRFVHPQFHLPYRDEQGGSCPDFVVLDFKEQAVFVVEVTAAWTIANLVGRVRPREVRWYRPLQSQLSQLDRFFSCWNAYRTALFVRADRYEAARQAFEGATDVSVIALDAIMRSWKWDWSEKRWPTNPLNVDVPSRESTV